MELAAKKERSISLRESQISDLIFQTTKRNLGFNFRLARFCSLVRGSFVDSTNLFQKFFAVSFPRVPCSRFFVQVALPRDVRIFKLFDPTVKLPGDVFASAFEN